MEVPMKHLIIVLALVLTAFGGINTWTQVSPSIVLPSGRSGVIYGTSWNGCTYRPSSNSVLFYSRYLGEEFPNTIYGNALTCWDVEQNRIRVLSIKDQSPRARHTYESFAYVESTDALYMMFGASSGCGSDGVMWEFSFSDNTWRQVSTTVPSAYGCEVHMIHWKTQDKILFIDGWNKMFQFDVQTRVWSGLTPNKSYSGDPAYGSQSCWDTKRDRWVFFNSGTLFAYDPATRAFTNLSASGSKPSGEGAITYIAKYDVYLAAGSCGTWVYNIASQSWTQLSGAGSLDGHPALYYNSTTNLCYYIRGWQGGEKRYTLKYTQTTATQARPSGTVQGLSVVPNPFSRTALIRVPAAGKKEGACLRVYDLRGRVIMDLTRGLWLGRAVFDARNLEPGMYAVEYRAGNKKWMRKVCLIK